MLVIRVTVPGVSARSYTVSQARFIICTQLPRMCTLSLRTATYTTGNPVRRCVLTYFPRSSSSKDPRPPHIFLSGQLWPINTSGPPSTSTLFGVLRDSPVRGSESQHVGRSNHRRRCGGIRSVTSTSQFQPVSPRAATGSDDHPIPRSDHRHGQMGRRVLCQAEVCWLSRLPPITVEAPEPASFWQLTFH